MGAREAAAQSPSARDRLPRIAHSRISVLIPTWRRSASLPGCLAGLEAQTRRPEEVVVVVRESDTDTRVVLSETTPQDFELRTVIVSAPGVVAAMNAGLAAMQGDIIALTDDDTVPRPDWLGRLEAHFQGHDDVGGVGGRDWIHREAKVEDGAESTVGLVRWYGRMIGNHHLGIGGPREVDVLKGANMSFRRAAIQGIGFDEQLRRPAAQPHFEVAFSLAVKRAGWKLIYDPAVAVDHYPAERFDDDRRETPSPQALQNTVHNEMYALLRWLPWWRKPLAFAYGLSVGTRWSPGLILAAEQWLRESDGADIRARSRASFLGRMDGLRTFLSTRRRALVQPLPGSRKGGKRRRV
jgi:GT2 family glycosyltransferase